MLYQVLLAVLLDFYEINVLYCHAKKSSGNFYCNWCHKGGAFRDIPSFFEKLQR